MNRNSSSAADRSYYLTTYIYSALNRLTQATQPNPVDPLQTLTESFAYDPVGNRTSSHLATGQIHDAANRLLDNSNFTFSYDANGNLVEQVSKANGDRTVYTYSVENQLVRVQKFTVAGGLSPVLTAAYRYDALGRRIVKEVTQAGATTITRYIYDNEDILLEFDGANVLQARYTHGPGIDESLIMLRSGQRFFYHADGLGSIWDLTDLNGNSVRSYTYDSFGQLLAESGTLPNPYTYTARELDRETGLYFHRNRYYDPTLGRFLSEDPVGILVGGNFYTYALNNPVHTVDPTGLLGATPPGDPSRRQKLKNFALALSGVVSDCSALVALIAYATALNTSSDAGIADLQAVLVGQGLEMREGRQRGSSVVPYETFRSTGFKQQFVGPGNQVQHAIAGIVLGFRFNWLYQQGVLVFIEREPEDIALYKATFSLGRAQRDERNRSSFADEVRKALCKEPGTCP